MARQEGRFGPSPAAARDTRRTWDPLELGVLALFAAVSVWLIGLDLWEAGNRHLVWTGIDGVYPIDQLQYLAWVIDASRHVLVSDLFVSGATPHDYLQPMIAISGGLTAAGVAPWLSLLLWKPIAILAIFLAVRAFCRRLLPTRAQRNAALLLALFAAFFNVLEDEWIPFQAWGYPFDLLSLAALIGALLAYDRSRSSGRASAAAPVLGALAAWLHPWQGELLIPIVGGTEALRSLSVPRTELRLRTRGRAGTLRVAVTTILATALPLAYYAALGHFDPVWQNGQAASQQSWPLHRVLLPLLPLLIAALPGYGRRPVGRLGLSARLWPPAALLVWAINESGLGAWSVYAWVGITVPLAVLAVDGAQGWGLARIGHHRWLAGLALAALTIPGTCVMLSRSRGQVAPGHAHQNLISQAENRALAYLAADPLPGSVLSPFPAGDAVPAETGRHTFVGDDRWSEQYTVRDAGAWNLVHGYLHRRGARALVRRADVRFVLAPCGSKDLRRVLGPLLRSVRRFGCVSVYAVR
jgi:hypothetical protein